MKELIERLKDIHQDFIDGEGGFLPSIADTAKDAADALERLTKALDFWKNGHMEMTAELFAVKRAQDTAVDEYIKCEEKVIALTSERDALRAALHSISLASQNSGSTKEGMGLYARAAIAGEKT